MKKGIELAVWVRLAGKICVNQSVRDKLFSLKIHEITFQKMEVLIKCDVLKDLVFLYASMVYDFEPMASWCIEQKIPTIFMAKIK